MFQKFQDALIRSEFLKPCASKTELLKLRGYYKQSLYGDNDMGRPPMTDVMGLMKWQVWRDLEGMSRDEAKQKYIEHMDTFCKLYNIP